MNKRDLWIGIPAQHPVFYEVIKYRTEDGTDYRFVFYRHMFIEEQIHADVNAFQWWAVMELYYEAMQDTFDPLSDLVNCDQLRLELQEEEDE